MHFRWQKEMKNQKNVKSYLFSLITSGGIQIFCQPVLLQKSYFPAGSVTKSHIFQQIN